MASPWSGTALTAASTVAPLAILVASGLAGGVKSVELVPDAIRPTAGSAKTAARSVELVIAGIVAVRGTAAGAFAMPRRSE